MAPNSPDSDTQSIHPASDPREIARHNLQRPSESVAKPERIGPYKILETLGEGGMGIVYLAEQSKPIHRRVALKIIKLGMDTKQVIARFETEREALALMNHPNVAKVFDAGATETGRPYFVMEYVAGIPITDYCDKHRLSTEERLRLFMDVCNAIQHAHQKGIIHRDIKPSNVLVAVQDEKPTPKVIDFGVAKATQHRLTEQTLFTEQGQLIGTPGYMSPEQAEMTALDIDTRTDIYSLGVLLYELLVGTMPFDTKTLLQAGLAEIQRIIREVDPPKPSTRLSALGSAPVGFAPRTFAGDRGPHGGPYARSSIDDIAHCRHTEPKALIRQIRGELDWIVMRAMEKDRTRRYDTANGLAMEIQRYLNDEPVLAGPPSARYRMKKFIRRHRPVVLGTAAVFGVLILGIITTGIALSREGHQRRLAEQQRQLADEQRNRAQEAEALAATEARRAETEAETAKQVSKFLVGLFEVSDPQEAKGNTITAREILDKGVQKIERELQDQPRVRAQLMATMGIVYFGLGLYEPAERLLRESIAVLKEQFGNDPLDVAKALEKLGFLLRAIGNEQEAAQLLEERFTLLQRTRGPDDPMTARAQADLNHLKGDMEEPTSVERLGMKSSLYFVVYILNPNDYDAEPAAHIKETRRLFSEKGEDEALRFLTAYWRRRLSVVREYALVDACDLAGTEIRRYYGPLVNNAVVRPALGSTVTAIAEYLVQRGDAAAAECMAREGLKVSRELLGDEHPGVDASTGTLARVLSYRAKYAEAELLSRDVLARLRRSLGNDHPSVASCLINLGRILAKQGRYEVSISLLTEGLEIQTKSLGENHRFVNRSLSDLAAVKGLAGNLEESEQLFREVLGRYREGPVNEPEGLAFTLIHLADVLSQKGETAEPERLQREALAIRRKLYGSQHPEVASSLTSLADSLERTEDFTETERVARNALEIWEYLYRLDNSLGTRAQRAMAMSVLGGALRGLGRFADAESLLLEGFRSLDAPPGPWTRHRFAAAKRLVRLYESWSAAEPGMGYAEKAAEWRAKLQPVNPTP